MRKHEVTHDPDLVKKVKVTCEQCGKTYLDKAQLDKHVNTVSKAIGSFYSLLL